MITSDRMAAVDENAAALGVPRKQLMESSGNAVASVVREHTAPGDSVTIVCGRGNNGGDGFVAARFLGDREVQTLLLGRSSTITTSIARENWTALQRAEVPTGAVHDASALADDSPDSTATDAESSESAAPNDAVTSDGTPAATSDNTPVATSDGTPVATAIDAADVVVDAMLGTGVTGALREPAATAARRINASSATVVAVDVPSGIDADTGDAVGVAVDADHVVSFHDRKPGLAEVDATVTVADIGIPDAAALFVERGDLLALDRADDAHKGDHGHVLVVGGGPYSGAPALAASATLRAGADLVTVACPESVAESVRSYSANLIVEPLPGDRLHPDHVGRLADLASDRDCTVLGPGLGRDDATLTAASEFLAEASGPVVVDADPLRVVPDVDTDAALLCTPHQGELEAMGGPQVDDWRERADAVEAFAADLDATLLVKGAYDVISDGETVQVNRTGNPGMTVGGTGDVLAGICGALASQFAPQRAGAIAAYANGSAGDRVVEEHGYGLVATDLLDRLPAVLWGGDRD